MYEYLNAEDLLSKHQFGFRRFHSTSSALLHSTNEWFINMDRGMFNISVFLNLKKGFFHELLVNKLGLYGMEQTSLNLLRSYLVDRTQMCSIKGKLSSPRTVKCGIPQVSIMGQLLFLIYKTICPIVCNTHQQECLLMIQL